jgi:hypothetical protein
MDRRRPHRRHRTDIAPTLTRAIEQVKAGKPALVDIIVDRREGAM